MGSETNSALYQELSAKHGWPDSTYLPKIFERLVTPEQAKILMQFPGTTAEIAERLELDQAVVEKQLQVLFEKGLAFSVKKGWRLNRIMDSLHDLTLINKKYWDAHGGKDMADLWVEFEKHEWFPKFVSSVKGLGEPLMRIIPAWEAIQDNPHRMPEEDIREIYKNAGKITDVPCCCRLEMYDADRDAPDGMCIALDKSAEYNLARGVGTELSFEQAMAIEKDARKYNMFTQVPNNADTNQIICHCDPVTCFDSRAFGQEEVPITEFVAKSRYVAVILPDTCTACQQCMEACPFDAIKMKKFPGLTKWKAYVDPEDCLGCGNCVVKCPKEGVASLKLVRSPDHIPGEAKNVYRDRY